MMLLLWAALFLVTTAACGAIANSLPGGVAIATRSLWAGIVAHALFNPLRFIL